MIDPEDLSLCFQLTVKSVSNDGIVWKTRYSRTQSIDMTVSKIFHDVLLNVIEDHSMAREWRRTSTACSRLDQRTWWLAGPDDADRTMLELSRINVDVFRIRSFDEALPVVESHRSRSRLEPLEKRGRDLRFYRMAHATCLPSIQRTCTIGEVVSTMWYLRAENNNQRANYHLLLRSCAIFIVRCTWIGGLENEEKCVTIGDEWWIKRTAQAEWRISTRKRASVVDFSTQIQFRRVTLNGYWRIAMRARVSRHFKRAYLYTRIRTGAATLSKIYFQGENVAWSHNATNGATSNTIVDISLWMIDDDRTESMFEMHRTTNLKRLIDRCAHSWASSGHRHDRFDGTSMVIASVSLNVVIVVVFTQAADRAFVRMNGLGIVLPTISYLFGLTISSQCCHSWGWMSSTTLIKRCGMHQSTKCIWRWRRCMSRDHRGDLIVSSL